MKSNLRRDVHSAFEVITPPLGGMPERVVETVLAERHGRLRKERMAYRLRFSLALVAAVLLVAVGAAAIMTWNSLHSANVSPAGPHLTALQQLEARPFRIPTMAATANCVPGPFTPEGNWGTGPLYGYAGSAITTSWGEYAYAVLYTDKAMSGPILVRVRDLVTGASMTFVGAYAAGPKTGTDVIEGAAATQHTELVLDESATTAGGWKQGWPVDHHRFVWDFLAGMPGSNGGPLGWQIDGKTFTETFTVC